MEKLVIDPSFWKDRKVFITGHTGFKGSWLSLWLTQLGAKVTGFSLKPSTQTSTDPILFEDAKVAGVLQQSIYGDIRVADTFTKAIQSSKPEIVIHMAAQPLVRESYIDPVGTYSTNVIGTVNLFEAIRLTPGIKAVLNITTDKCYENKEWVWGYRENESLGGYDPYSSSKACAELVSSAYRRSFFQQEGVALATARSGNVIGGGDWAKDRIIPDAMRAFMDKTSFVVRNPAATRPWQHVLEPLSGYLMLIQQLIQYPDVFAESLKRMCILLQAWLIFWLKAGGSRHLGS
jgi:CDP-glucose 4,6-dehydratase